MAKKSNIKNGKDATKSARPGNLIRHLREGRLLSVSLFKRHGWLIFIATVVAIALMGQRYSNQTKMENIKKLNAELALEKSILINEKAEYMSLIRENALKELMRRHNLDLDYQEQPPYEIPRD